MLKFYVFQIKFWLIEKQNATNHFFVLLLPFQLEYVTILLMSLEQRKEFNICAQRNTSTMMSY